MATSPTTSLNTPGSTRVSSLLMQDTVTTGSVSIAPGLSAGTLTGRVALFANPYLDGKEEALVVDTDGQLTYLQRVDTETGWSQSPVTGGGASPIKADEVVVVVHPTDLTVWAIYTSPSADQQPQALQLITTSPGVTTWQSVPDAIVGPGGLTLRLSRLYVYYDGRTPYITGIGPAGNIVRIIGLRGGTGRFHWEGFSKPAFSKVDDFAAGHVAVSTEGAVPAAPIGYVRMKNELVRFNTATNEEPRTIATDAARIVGVYPAANYSDLGCIYLDTAGNLVTWNRSAQGPTTGKTPGLGFVTATSWIDVNLMLHVYGLDAAGALKVLHQSSWNTIGGAPNWTRTKVVSSNETVPVSVALVPKVAAFAVDPFPDNQPNELVKLEGAKSPDETFSFYAQDIASARWSRDKVRLPSSADPHLVTNYVSTVTVLDQRGNPMPSLTVKVSAESLAEIQVDGASYLVGPSHSAQLPTNALGMISIALPADGLTPPTLHVDAVGLAQGAIIDPAAAVQDYLAGNGTLSSQKGLFDQAALENAKVDGAPLVEGKANRDAIPGTVTSIKNTFKIASGQPVTSTLYQGSGPAPRIHGFAFGSALGGPTIYREFAGPEDLEAHLAAIRSRPEYGGIWDDFLNWAGDVWQGIKDGVILVDEVLFGPVIKVVIWIGGKLVELAGFVLDTIQAAVHVVEAVFAKIAVVAAKVVDWLKALFSFKDIWDTKEALREGMKVMLDYGTATAEHFGKVPSGWFAAQSATACGQAEGLKATYTQRAVGDVANQVPTVTDGSGQVSNLASLGRDPQSSWLLNQTLGAPALSAARAAAPLTLASTPISDAFTGFMAKLQSTGIDKDVKRISGDPYTVASNITDPRDPDGAAKTSAPALFGTLLQAPAPGNADDSSQNLLDAILKATDDVVGDLLALLKTVNENIFKFLDDTKLKLGPVNTFYKWIQEQNGIKEPKELTLGELVFLIGAFAYTTTYKLFNGVDSAPFPGGKFPALPVPPWHPAYDEQQAGAADPSDMRKLQIAAGAFGILGCIFNGLADLLPVLPYNVPSGIFDMPTLLIAGGTSVFTQGLFGMIAACPPVLGLDWRDAGGAWAGAFAVQGVTALLSLGAMTIPVITLNPEDAILRNAGKVLGPLFGPILGPILMTGLGIGGLIAVAVAVARFKAENRINDYSAAQPILFTLPSVLQFLRIGATWKDVEPERVLIDQIRCGLVAGFDVLTTGCSASMVLAAAVLSAPVIPSQQPPDAVVGKPYSYKIEASGGDKVFNFPLKDWKVASGRLPEWLSLDAQTGTLSGTPKTTGSVAFSVTCTDNFGPPQPAAPQVLSFNVRAATTMQNGHTR